MKTRLLDALGREYKFSSITYPGGEKRVILGEGVDNHFTLDARIRNSEDLVEVLAIGSALRNIGVRVKLYLPYFPGARADRLEPGGEFGARLYANIINSIPWKEVVILDPHSDVVPALVKNVRVQSQFHYLRHFVGSGDYYLLSPDAGAEKRLHDVVDALRLMPNARCLDVIQARKRRDPLTGMISSFKLPDIINSGRYIVVDDICDGGYTFLEIARQFWKTAGNSSLDLFVTHGIFSKGAGYLLDAGYGKIGTTNSFYDAETTHPAIYVYPCVNWI